MAESATTAWVTMVDAAWYLRNYPDVAQAGMDPQLHWERHGCCENRIPRPLRALQLDAALWSGLIRSAQAELEQLWAKSADAGERASAAWALARWHATRGDWFDALPYLQRLQGNLPPWLDHPGTALLVSEILVRNGLQHRAQAELHQALRRHDERPDLCLAAANALLPCPTSEDHLSDTPIAWLSRIYASAGLEPVSRRNMERSLSLDNISSPALATSTNGRGMISVIMPAFNVAAQIETALHSLQAQTWQDFEIIVIDDHSHDDTCIRVQAMAVTDPRIRLVRCSSNGGAYAARNKGLAVARGAFVINHDSDDWSHPQRLELMAGPLLEDASLVATIADWVRVDSDFRFVRWRIEDRLIEPSVATLMVRRDAIDQLGGWDEVRVAADAEFHARLVRRYGKDSVSAVAPAIPLVLARELPGSLTSSSDTHIRTSLFGLRRHYMELAAAWHRTACDADLKLARGSRKFAVPRAMLSATPSPTTCDLLVISDLSGEGRTTEIAMTVMREGLAQGKTVAAFHWPDYENPAASLGSELLELAIASRVELTLPEQDVETKHVVIVGRHLLRHPLDAMPRLRFQHCQVVDQLSELRGLMPTGSARSKAHPHDAEPTDSLAPELFDAKWYLQRYPDVRAAGVDAWDHYRQHGAAEGRDPAPWFHTAWYWCQCPTARTDSRPALLHYLHEGRQLGLDPRPPELLGHFPRRTGRPTILLAAHAAELQIYGAERCLLEVLGACQLLELNVVVSVPTVINEAYIDALRTKAQQVICVPTAPWQDGAGPYAYAIQRFEEIIRAFDVALVQANTITIREPLIAARRVTVPAVVHAHESPCHDDDFAVAIGLHGEQIIREVRSYADHIIANSAFTAAAYGEAKASSVASNIVDQSLFQLNQSVCTDVVTAALISSNLPKKGLSDMVELARSLADDTPNLRLLLIGPENEHIAQLRDQLRCGHVPPNLQIMPYVEEPQAALAQANIVLNLSHCHETFGRTILEGMAAGRAVVAYRQGALPELIEDGVSGYLVAPKDIEGVAEKLRLLCREPERILAMGQAGRSKAREFTTERLASELLNFYQTALPSIKHCRVSPSALTTKL